MKTIMMAAITTVALMYGPAFAQSGGGSSGDSSSFVGPAATSNNTADTDADLGTGDSGMGDARRASSGASMNEPNKVTTDPGAGGTGLGSGSEIPGSTHTNHSADTNVDKSRGGRAGTQSGGSGGQ